MKRFFLFLFIAALAAFAFGAYLFFMPATAFNEESKFVYLRQEKNVKSQFQNQIKKNLLFKYPSVFNLAAEQLDVWKRLKPGKFEIKKDESLFSIIKKLRNNQQTPVKLTINRLRTKKGFASLIGKQFELDSSYVYRFITNPDSIKKWHVDTAQFFTLIIPDSYEYYWTASIHSIIEKMADHTKKFWQTDNRAQKAKALGLTPQEVYILASIVEEETNKDDEKGKIASVYYNRLKLGMPLGADPTVKFALGDFNLRRILFGHLNVASPYNTYRVKGLPPGPICTPSAASLKATLSMPQTKYLYFVAEPNLTGYHRFSTNFEQHKQYAREYQTWLNEYFRQKNQEKNN